MKMKVHVLMLLISLVLFFSGCASKTVYVAQKCEVEKPVRSVEQNCKVIKDDFEFMECAVENHMRLKGDYEALEIAFEGCK